MIKLVLDIACSYIPDSDKAILTSSCEHWVTLTYVTPANSVEVSIKVTKHLNRRGLINAPDYSIGVSGAASQ